MIVCTTAGATQVTNTYTQKKKKEFLQGLIVGEEKKIFIFVAR